MRAAAASAHQIQALRQLLANATPPAGGRCVLHEEVDHVQGAAGLQAGVDHPEPLPLGETRADEIVDGSASPTATRPSVIPASQGPARP
jgi:hypothetical protein